MSSVDTPPRVLAICRIGVLLALLLLPLAPLATRVGLLPWQIGLLLSAVSVLVSAVLLLLLLALLARPRFRVLAPRIGLLAALAAMPVAIGAAIVLPARALPTIHDISTDIADPPLFSERTVALRGAASNPIVRGTALDAMQRAAYPTLEGLDSALPPVEAVRRAEEIAGALGWELTAVDAATGFVEARETTFWFGFVDDVAVRIRTTPQGSRIDLRSVSRVGRGDLGANAARIERFLAAWREREAAGNGS